MDGLDLVAFTVISRARSLVIPEVRVFGVRVSGIVTLLRAVDQLGIAALNDPLSKPG